MGMHARFVGRRDELSTLRDVFAYAETTEGVSRGAIVTIVGEPGIGKSALADEATAGRRTIWARAREGDGAPPMWLWAHVLEELGASLLDSTGMGDTGVDRFAMFDATSRQLIGLHSADGFVVVLDDLQWADAESLAFVDFLAADAEQHGLVVLATVRAGELAHLPRSTVVIELDGLAPNDVDRLLGPSTGFDPIDPDLAAEVCQHTGGNPFFIGEVHRLLTARGRESEASHWRSVMPEGVRSVLTRRFARLSEPAARTLFAAAELGEDIDPALVAATLDHAVADALDELAESADAGLVRTAHRGFTFGHSLVREAARAQLAPSERRRLNQRAADALRAQGHDHDVGRIAHHLLNADAPDAGAWAARAGHTAYSASMYAEAASWFERAIKCGPDDAAGPIRVRRAEALSRSGRIDEAEAAFLAITREARSHGDSDLFARATLGIGSIGGGFEVRQLDPAQQALLCEAIECLGDDDSAVLSTLLSRLSIARSLDAEHVERSDLTDRALAMARRLGDDAAIGGALGAWCDAHAGPADIDARAVASAEMVVAAQRCGDVELELLARRLALVASLEAGDIGLVRRHAAAFTGITDRLRLPQFTWYARLIQGMLAHLDGDLERARALATESAELGRRAQSVNARMLADGALLPAVDRDLGNPGYLEHAIAVNTGIAEASRGLNVAAPFHVYTVGFGGTPEDVATGLPGWAEMWRSAGPDDGLALFLGFHLARGAALVGDRALIAETEQSLLPYADRFALDGTGAVCYGPISAALASLASARGDRAGAVRWHRHAIAACRRIGARLLQERFEHELEDRGQLPEAGTPLATRHGILHRDGEFWLVGFAGCETRLKDSKGLADLAVLVARPEHDVHVFNLVGAVDADRGHAGELIDAAARTDLERRITTLTEQIEAAENAGHDDRAAELDDERATLITHLAGALGLGGRPRVAASDVERARKAVGMRVREACRKIDGELPELGRHLHNAVHTGTWCSYRPDTPVEWTL